MKRACVSVLCMLLCMTVSLFAGGQKEKAAGAAAGVSAPGVFPIVKDTVTLNVFARQEPNVGPLDQNAFTKVWEAKTNVHINWTMVPAEGLEEKKKLSLASGNYPDVYMGAGMSKEDQMVYGPQGVFFALNDLIEKQGFFIKQVLADGVGRREAATAPDGKIYSLFYINECFHCSMSMKMWINRIWLKGLGIAMPTTTDQFYAALKAFKDKDPNGNGKADEIPLSGSINNWSAVPYDFAMNAFIYNDGATRLFLKGGKVTFAADKPEWRDGLRYMIRLFKEGLLDPAAFTQDRNQLVQLGENPDAMILGATGAGYTGNFTKRNSDSGRERNYDVVPSLLGPNGHRSTVYDPTQVAPGTGSFVITKACKYPEVAFKWADGLYDYETSFTSYYGAKGVYWDWAKAGDVGVDGKPAVWTPLKPVPNPTADSWANLGIWVWDNKAERGITTAKDADPYDPKNLELRLYRETRDKMEPYKTNEYLPALWVTADVAAELAQIESAVRTYVAESSARFIVGKLDIDRDWDSYVGELTKMRVSRLLEIYQKLYDGQYKK